MGVEWADSAEKHYPIADGMHAVRNRKVFLLGFDKAQDGTGEIVDLVIGPARDGQMLEVFLHRRIPQTTYLFHVLHLRPKTWRRAQEIIARRKGENP
ncbi:hypothetical protein GCM10009847_06680 [Leucobacter tardus]|uniref:Uncharacterized protein n=1 Tax=Leucobacter tardus TaxID=501483 RepID=A0A939TJ53_9MICO|nr:hypothetical protein [Leucobacter tardus]MBO2988871.1 hypothetical protein [Leucobacter tardus]